MDQIKESSPLQRCSWASPCGGRRVSPVKTKLVTSLKKNFYWLRQREVVLAIQLLPWKDTYRWCQRTSYIIWGQSWERSYRILGIHWLVGWFGLCQRFTNFKPWLIMELINPDTMDVENQRATTHEKIAVCEPRTTTTRGCAADRMGTAAGLEKTCGSRSSERRRSWTTAHGQTAEVLAVVSSTRLRSWCRAWAHRGHRLLLKLVEQLSHGGDNDVDLDGSDDNCLIYFCLGFIYNRV